MIPDISPAGRRLERIRAANPPDLDDVLAAWAAQRPLVLAARARVVTLTEALNTARAALQEATAASVSLRAEVVRCLEEKT